MILLWVLPRKLFILSKAAVLSLFLLDNIFFGFLFHMAFHHAATEHALFILGYFLWGFPGMEFFLSITRGQSLQPLSAHSPLGTLATDIHYSNAWKCWLPGFPALPSQGGVERPFLWKYISSNSFPSWQQRNINLFHHVLCGRCQVNRDRAKILLWYLSIFLY